MRTTTSIYSQAR